MRKRDARTLIRWLSGGCWLLVMSCATEAELLAPREEPPNKPDATPVDAQPYFPFDAGEPLLCGDGGLSRRSPDTQSPDAGLTMLDCFFDEVRRTMQTPPFDAVPGLDQGCVIAEPSGCCLRLTPCWRAGGSPTVICPSICDQPRGYAVLRDCPIVVPNAWWRPLLGQDCQGNFVCDDQGRALSGRTVQGSRFLVWCDGRALQHGVLWQYEL